MPLCLLSLFLCISDDFGLTLNNYAKEPNSICSGMKKGPIPARNPNKWAGSKLPMDHLCFSMKSGTCPSACKPNYCISFRTNSSSALRAMTALQEHHWPGNVRELKNIIEHAVIISPDDKLRVKLPEVSGPGSPIRKTLDEIQKDHILAVLKQTGWRVRGRNGAAEVLGLKLTTLDSKMARLSIRPESCFSCFYGTLGMYRNRKCCSWWASFQTMPPS